MTRVAITGATGAMGRTLRETAADRDDLTVATLVTRSPEQCPEGEVRVVTPDEAATVFESVDVIVDFTVPEASLEYVQAAKTAGTPIVIGTTGFDDDGESVLEGASQLIPLLVAPNFSPGIQALHAALEAAIDRLPDYDVELTETHHNRKRDAPSGTALGLLETIESRREDASRVHGRSGEQPRETGEIGVHARRAGAITGEHEILLAAHGESIQLTHRAESRDVFATGALQAAAWLVDKPAGSYRFGEVLEA